MHYSCFLGYLESIKPRQVQQITRTIPEDVKRHEFLCPLCKAVNNVLVPIYYSVNSEKFAEKLTPSPGFYNNPDISFDELVGSPVSDEQLSNIRRDLVSNVRSKVKPQYWFIDSEKGIIDIKCKPFNALNYSLGVLSVLSLPFDGVSAIISKSIESIEISLRGRTYSANDIPLVTSQLSNQNIVALRVWCQLRELVRCTEITTSTSDQYSRGFLTYPERLLGLVKNIFDEPNLVFDGEDYFKLLVGAEEVSCVGLDYHRLLYACYAQHFKQSLFKVLAFLELKHSELDLTVSDDDGNAYGESGLLNELADDSIEFDFEKLTQIYDVFTNTDSKGQFSGIIYSMVVKLMTPFLRDCLIYSFIRFANLSQVAYPNFQTTTRECDKLTAMMNLPNLDSMIYKLDPMTTFKDISSKTKQQIYNSHIPYPNQIKLISLPSKLNSFYTHYQPKLQHPIEDPAICLFCAQVVNLQKPNYGDTWTWIVF
ncbi:unnamed protein product [Ambrosiozyma monospora]|uniref:Unnamed protein product n=1 Tax=Ambrosiozyma monospora TaxID=43982 RepID=A0ACB5T829_AMBMO|nr:unnamed protein product [Ambrosiozyma monospora]